MTGDPYVNAIKALRLLADAADRANQSDPGDENDFTTIDDDLLDEDDEPTPSLDIHYRIDIHRKAMDATFDYFRLPVRTASAMLGSFPATQAERPSNAEFQAVFNLMIDLLTPKPQE